MSYDQQSVNQPVLVSGSHLEPITNFFFLTNSCWFLDVWHPLWWKKRSVTSYNCFWTLPEQSISGPSPELSWVYLQSMVNQPVHLGMGLPLGPMTRFYPYPFFSDNCFVLPVGFPLWWEDGSVTYSAIADWSGNWGPITLHYRLILDCVPSLSPLTTRRDYGGGILTCLHTRLTSTSLLKLNFRSPVFVLCPCITLGRPNRKLCSPYIVDSSYPRKHALFCCYTALGSTSRKHRCCVHVLPWNMTHYLAMGVYRGFMIPALTFFFWAPILLAIYTSTFSKLCKRCIQ
jgi:hypothetical protein